MCSASTSDFNIDVNLRIHSPGPLTRGTLLRLLICGVIGMFMAFPGRSAAADGEGGQRPNRASYVLRPMDLIKIEVFDEPDLERELRVSQDYNIALPLIGPVSLRGKTVREAERLVRDLYGKDYLVNPQINITVVEYSPRSVNVLGAVNSPGSVVIPAEHPFNLLDAIAHSGGFSRLANRARISLTRTFPDGHTENFTINADKLVTGDASNSWSVADGDVIFVPESVL
jgi:polysaccharide biosynthesis/export protein